MELLVTIILLGTFGLLVAQLFHATFMLNYTTANAQNAAASFNFAELRLREDVWTAQKIAVKDPHTAAVTLSDGGGAITWTLRNDKLSRRVGDDTDTWTAPPGATFQLDGSTLLLAVAESKTARAATLSFASQRTTVNGMLK
jgi:hypothetical protein